MQQLFQLVQLSFPLFLLILFVPLLLFPFPPFLCTTLFLLLLLLLLGLLFSIPSPVLVLGHGAQLFLFPFESFHLVHAVYLEGGYGAIVFRAKVRGKVETDEAVERSRLWESKRLGPSDVLANERSDLFPLVPSAGNLVLTGGLVPVFLLVFAANADAHFSDDAAEKLPHGDLYGLYADLVAQLDDYPVFVGFARREHVPVAGPVEQGGGVLCLGGGRVDAGGTVWGGIVVLAVVGVRGGGGRSG